MVSAMSAILQVRIVDSVTITDGSVNERHRAGEWVGQLHETGKRIYLLTIEHLLWLDLRDR